MKKLIVALFISLSFLSQLAAQENFQGTLKRTPGVPNGISLFLKCTAAFSGKVSSLTVCLAIPTSVGLKPTVTANNSPNPSIAFIYQEQANQNIQGVPHYILSMLGDGDVTTTGQIFASGANVEIEVARFVFSAGIGSAPIKWVNLPEGGTGDGNFNFIQGYFGFSLDGADRVNQFSMFYATPGVSTPQNEIIVGGYDGLSVITTVDQVALPVQFTSFDAVKKLNNAQLTLAVLNESSTTQLYELQRSFDAVQFEKITLINPLHNNQPSNLYSIIDENITSLNHKGIIYYRIKQTDIDGQLVYSQIKSIKLQQEATFIAYPNPTTDFTTVRIDALINENIVLALINAEGKQIYTSQWAVTKGLNFKKIDMRKYAKGRYLLQVYTGGTNKTVNLIKL